MSKDNQTSDNANEDQNQETKVTIGDKEYTTEQIQTIMTENENLSQFKGKDTELNFATQILGLMQQGEEGFKAIEEVVQHAKTKAGYGTPDPVEEFKIELGDDQAENNKKIAEGLTQVYELIQQSNGNTKQVKSDLTEMVKSLASDMSLDRSAVTAVDRVKNELGIEVTASEIAQAQRDKGLKDPIEAILLTRRDDVLKAREQAGKPKPSFITDDSGNKPDISKMNTQERYKFFQENPDAVEQYRTKGMA